MEQSWLLLFLTGAVHGSLLQTHGGGGDGDDDDEADDGDKTREAVTTTRRGDGELDCR